MLFLSHFVFMVILRILQKLIANDRPKATVTQRIRLCDCLRLVIAGSRGLSQGEKPVPRPNNTISCDNDATRYD